MDLSLGTAISLAVERIVDPVEGMHRSISGRWFAAVGPAGKPVQVAHDTISRTVYKSIRLAGAVTGTGIDIAANTSPATRDRARALANGFWGDQLGRYEKQLGISMSLRDRAGSKLDPGPALGTALPDATGRLVILAHGFVDTERCWQTRGSHAGLLDAVEAEPGLTPLTIRYNTGGKVADNGRLLADLMESVHGNWPVPVTSIALVGHSMGGLVVRAACSAAQEHGYRWLADATDVVTLGAPHLGSPLEKLTELAARGLDVAAETRPLAEFLDTRSRGIKDLRFGTTTDDNPANAAKPTQPKGIAHHFVAGVITSNPWNPAGVLVGDLVVRPGSATGERHLEPTNVMIVGGVSHNDLIHDKEVIAKVLNWLQLADGSR